MNTYITKRNQGQSGFTLIELLITIAIVGILAAVAIPSYQDYTKRAYYAEVVNATTPFKVAVADCYQALGGVAGCDNGTNGIPAALGAAGQVASVTVADGVITATPKNTHGIESTDTYILTPNTSVPGVITWDKSGNAITSGLVK